MKFQYLWDANERTTRTPWFIPKGKDPVTELDILWVVEH